jgi:hypothetical protein
MPSGAGKPISFDEPHACAARFPGPGVGFTKHLLCALGYVWRCPLKQFLAVYLGSPAAMGAWNSLPEAERNARTAEGVRAWHAWADRHRDRIVIDGAPLGRTKSISRSGIADIRNAMAAFTVVRAESHEAAAQLFEGHPHFSIFPGESVEVMECLPIPEGMAQS